MATTKDNDKPTATHPAVDRMSDAWQTCRDVAGGTRAVKRKPERYLPRHESEDKQDWKARIAGAELYNGFRRTVAAMVGLATQRPVAPSEETPEAFGAVDWKNVDGAGTDGATFARKLLADALITGLAGILVDAPEVAHPEQISAADEQARGLRAYWIHVSAEDVISWRTVKVDGQLVLVQLVVRECVEQAVGEFGVALETRYRVFRRQVSSRTDEQGVTVPVVGADVQWQLWRENEKGEAEFVRGGTLRGPRGIPFSPLVCGNDPAYMECDPPLLDLADVNLAHYRVSADRRWLMHIGCVPVPVRIGYRAPVEGTTQPIGPNILQEIPQGGDFKWAEITGSAFEPTKAELEALERRMASLGMAFLASETRAAETAEAKRIDSQAQNATLASVVTAFKACLDGAGAYHAQYQRLEAPPTFDVNTDFERQLMETGLAQLLSDMETKGQLSLDTLFALLKRGNLLPHDFDADGEQTRIAKKGAQLLEEMDGDPSTRPMPGDDDEDAPPPRRPPAGSGATPSAAAPTVDLQPVLAAIEALTPAAPPAPVDVAAIITAITSAIAQLRVELTAIATAPDRIQVVALPVPAPAAPAAPATAEPEPPAPVPLAWEITKDETGKIVAKAIDVTTSGGK